MQTSRLFTALSLLSLLTACGAKKSTEEVTAATSSAPAAAAPATPAPDAAAPPAAAPPATFDISSVPISTTNLGGFPYVSKLPGYKIAYASDSVAFDFDRSYVYDGQALVPVEGRVLRCEYRVIDDKKRTSDLMVQRNYENLLKSLGGVQVSTGKLPEDAVKKVGREEYDKHAAGLTPNYHEIATYVIRQKDKEVWVQVSPNDDRYQLNVTEKAAMPQQATTLPAAELKKN